MNDEDIHHMAADAGERHPEAAPRQVDPTTSGGGLGEPAVGDLPGAGYEPPSERGARVRIEEEERQGEGDDRTAGQIESARDADPRPSRSPDEELATAPVGSGAQPSLIDRIASASSRLFGGAAHDGGGTGVPSGRVDGRASVEGRPALDTEGPDPSVADRVRDPGEE